MKSLTNRLLKAAFLLGILTLFIGCGKEKPTLAKIRVINTNNESVQGAEVVLCPCPSPVLGTTIPNDTAFTDADGWAIFNYTDDHDLGTAGFRVLDILVNSGDSIFGTGIIKVYEQEENIEAVIVAAP